MIDSKTVKKIFSERNVLQLLKYMYASVATFNSVFQEFQVI